MRVVVVGGEGQLGQALLKVAPKDIDVRGLSRAECDVTAPAVDKLADADVIINTAAFTNVDGAEAAPDAARAINAVGAGALAEVANKVGAHFIHISTDYVFGEGVEQRPLLVDDPKEPNTVYGKTKLEGELAVLSVCSSAAIVRTAWLFSGDLLPHKDFVSTMLRLARGSDPVRVVNDQWGSPTNAFDLAAGLWEVAQRRVGGVLHGVGAGQATWYDLAREVFEVCGADPERVSPCTTEEFPRPAPRPHWSVLDTSSWLAADLSPLPEWRTAVRRSVSTKL